jgi:hypothetical protein
LQTGAAVRIVGGNIVTEEDRTTKIWTLKESKTIFSRMLWRNMNYEMTWLRSWILR